MINGSIPGAVGIPGGDGIEDGAVPVDHLLPVPVHPDVAEKVLPDGVCQSLVDHGQVDILVNNAGGAVDWLGGGTMKRTLFVDSTEEAWNLVVSVNLLGPMIVCRAVLGNMIKRHRGKIINVASVAGVNGLAGLVDYSAAKGGVIALTRGLALELGEHNINVNAVSPGSIDTHPGTPATFLRRPGQPEDVANLVLFLASEESDFITGQNYIIDGGRTISMTCP